MSRERFNINTGSLPKYVEQNRALMLGNAAFGFDTFRYLTLQIGIKTEGAINLLNTSVELQDGSGCGFNAKGDDTFTQRVIKTGLIKVNKSYCDKQLLGKYTQYEVQIAATKKERLPFEDYFMEGVNQGIAERNEAIVWNGDTSSGDENLKRYDGFLKIAKGDTSVVKVEIDANASAYDAVLQMVAKIPAKARKRGKVRIFCAPEFRDKFTMELVAKNLFNYAPDNEDNPEIQIPGTSVRLCAVGGLTDKKSLLAGTQGNMFYGCDMENDNEVYDLWYSQDNREHRLAVEYNAGVNFAFPDEIVLGTIASAGV